MDRIHSGGSDGFDQPPMLAILMSKASFVGAIEGDEPVMAWIYEDNNFGFASIPEKHAKGECEQKVAELMKREVPKNPNA